MWKIDAPHPDENPRELVGHEQSITDLRFVEGSTLLASTSNDATVRLWHLDAGTVATLRGHDQVVRELLLTRDAEWLVSVGDDGSARLWPMTATSFAARICDAIGTPVPDPLHVELFGAAAADAFCIPR